VQNLAERKNFMKCSDCGADNCQRLEVAYQSGTSNIQTQTRSSGLGLGRDGLGLGVVKSKTSGVSQTQLSAKASPPRKQRYLPWVVLFFVGWMVASSANLNHWVWLIVGIGAMAGSVYMGHQAFQFNRKEWPGMYQYWLESWICHTCGKIFHQSEAVA
jgi:DNA-directed RNA polymerase subunit RPC12/RpoP